MRYTVLFAVALVQFLAQRPAYAGSVFATCHDPDFHVAENAYNPAGARRIIQVAVSYILDPAYNPFASTAPRKFLFVESKIPVPGGHLRGKNGIVLSGYAEGADFEHHDAATLAAELSLLGVKYASLVVASDFGGTLTQAELDILNANLAGITAFLNAGGGVFAMAETNYTGLTPGGQHWNFLPMSISSFIVSEWEIGFSVTPFGASLGLTDADVNGNFCHCAFNPVQGLMAVDLHPLGHIMTLAGRDPTTSVSSRSWGSLKILYR